MPAVPPRKEPASTLLGLPAGPDLEKAGVGEVDADETQLPGAHPAGIPGQLSWELHGEWDLGLWRAKDRLRLVSEASRPTTTPSLLPTPEEALPALPQAFPTLEPPPQNPLLPGCTSTQTSRDLRPSLQAVLVLNLGYLSHPTGALKLEHHPPAPRYSAGIIPGPSKVSRSPGLSHDCLTPGTCKSRKRTLPLRGHKHPLSIIHRKNISPILQRRQLTAIKAEP